MTEIRDAGSLNYTTRQAATQPKKIAEEGAKAPTDEVVISKPKESMARKIIHLPAKVIGAAVGGVTAAANAPLHIIPGAVKGIQEGLTSDKGERSEGAFHATYWLQNLALGAGAAVALTSGGWIAAGLGALGAAIFSGVSSFVGERSGAYEKMIENVEKNVDKAVADNTGNKTKVMVQSAVEGSIIGGGAAFKEGGKVGYQAGKGIVEGLFAGVEGIVEGTYEGIKDAITGK